MDDEATRAELKPCPFCGDVTPEVSDNGAGLMFNVHCGNQSCRAKGPWERCAADAVSAWNSRPAEPEAEPKSCPTCGAIKPKENSFCSDGFHAPGPTYWPLNPAEPDLRAVLEEARRTVELCAKTFRRYGEIHRTKGTEDGNLKAANNDDLAEFCEQSLARIDTALHASASQEQR